MPRLSLLVLLIAVFFGWRNGKIPHDLESHMGLRLERVGSDWRFSWNPDAPLISKATRGHLLITDGTVRKFLDLDSSDLRGGAIIYAPVTNNVLLRLEIDKAESAESASESIQITGALAAAVSEMPSPGLGSNRTDGPGVTRPAVPAPAPRTEHFGARPGESNVMPNGVPTLRAVKSSRDNRKIPDRPMVQVAANANFPRPVLVAKLDAPNVQTLPPTLLVGPPAISPDLRAPLLPASELVQRSIQAEAAELIERTDPIYPPLARAAHFSGSVEVRFHILTNGTVHDISVVKGSSILVPAALEAVQKWRYKPARLNGTSIETDGRAILEFK